MDESIKTRERDDRILRQFKARLRRSRDHYSGWREETYTLYDFKEGKQWSPEDEEIMREAEKPTATFNLTEKFLEAVGGLQINNRQEIRYFPREQGDVGVNDLATGAVKWNRDLSNAEFEESEAFADMVLCGLGYVDHRLEDTTDPEGYIAQERADPLEVFPDPVARRRNLTDGRYIIRIRGYPVDEYLELFEDEDAEDLEGLASSDYALDEKTLAYIDRPQDYQDDDRDPSATVPKIRVADYQWWELEDSYLVTAEGLGRKDFTREEWKQIETQLKNEGVQYQVQKVRQRCYYRALICGDRVKMYSKLPTKGGFLLKAITGKRNRNDNTWRGMGRALKGPNDWVNKFFSSILWQLMVNPKGGLLAEKDAFDKPSEAEESWADPSRITFLRPGALAEKKIEQKPSAAFPAGMFQMSQFAMGAMPEVSGLNLELLGLADRQQAGIVESQRKQSAMAMLAWAFDAMRLYYRESGRTMLDLVREFMADGRLIRIVGDTGRKYVPLLKDRLTGVFDIVVDEAPTSVNMRERTWAIIESILPVALKTGIKIPPDILDYAPLPEELAEKWKKQLQPSPEDQQRQQQQIMLMVKQALAEIRKTEGQAAQAEATAELNTAKAEETRAMIPGEVIKGAAEAGAAQAGNGAG